MKMPRASVVQKAERRNRARLLLLQGVPPSEAAPRLTQEFSLSPRQAYRYLQQAQHLKEPIPPVEAKRKFTLKLAAALVRGVRKHATKHCSSNSEVVSQALLAQILPRGTFPGSVSAPGCETTAIDLGLVEKLASIGCTVAEIDGVIGASQRGLIGWEKDETVRDAIKRGGNCGLVNYRRMLWTSAIRGNVRALIRLGKQMLGQRSFNGAEKNQADIEVPPLIIQVRSKDDLQTGEARMPSASAVRKAERLDRASVLLGSGRPRSEAVQCLSQDCSRSPRQAYRYLEQARHRTEPSQAKLAFTVKLAPSLIRWARTEAAEEGTTITEVVSEALLAQLGPLPGYAGAPGPKKTSIDLGVVTKLASIGCTREEIGGVVGVSERTLIRREKEEKFREAIDRGRALGRVSLRTAQWAAAERGKITMLIWLGKQMLGQRDFEGGENNDVDRAIPPLIISVSDDNPGEGEA